MLQWDPRRLWRSAFANGSLGAVLDFVSDWALAAFAVWTLIAYAGMATQAPVSVLTPIWLATIPFVGLGLAHLRSGSARSSDVERPVSGGRATQPLGRALPVVGVGAGLVSAIVAARYAGLPWTLVWLGALVAVAAAIAAGKLWSRGTVEAEDKRDWRADLFVTLTGIGFAVISLFLFRANADDAFYVNRATATAQLDRIPVLDVIFSHEEGARGGGAGLPVDSYSALQGALAQLVGLHPLSMVYFVFPPIFTFLATWALWRLVRAWAPRYAWLCFVLGTIFWIWSAQFPLTSGNYFLNRMWQGKVVFVAWLLPTVYLYLTQWLGKRDARRAVLLLAAGLASIGLTGSATFVAPLLLAAALLPLLVVREWRTLSVPLAAALIPLGIGIFVLWRFPLSETVGAHALRAAPWFYHEVIGVGMVGAIAAVAIWAAPWIVRAGPPGRLTTGLALVVTVLLTPGVLELLNDVSGLTGTLRRTFWVVPYPALVGLLAAVPLAPRLGRVVPVTTTAVLAGLLVVFGTPLWINVYSGASAWIYPPRWKMRGTEEARAILHHYHGSGPVLADMETMRAVALLTVEPKAINARTSYLRRTELPAREIAQRLTVSNFITGREPTPSGPEVRRALSDLGVGLVCVRKHQKDLAAKVEELGSYRPAFETSEHLCFESGSSMTS